MGALAATALTGAAALGVGAIGAALPRRLCAALTLQAVGIALLGVAGAAVLLSGDAAGAAFTSDLAPGLGIDPLSGFFLAVLAITAVPALVFARAYVPAGPAPRAVGALTAAFLLALAGVLVARDVTTFLASWELMTLVPAAAILAARRDAAVRAAVFAYVAMTHVGGAGVWIALLTLAAHRAIGDPAALAAAGAGVQTLVALAALVGFGTKAGIVPLHSWLPRAHPVAPAHLSALMSGMMIKVALYGLIRVVFEWLGATPRWLGVTLLTLGVLSALGGVLWALVQQDLKRLLAYCSIENVGVVLLGLGASLLFADAGERLWAAIAFAAALLHIANHAIFKVLLFLAAGALERAVGALDLDRMGGLLRRMPQTGAAFLVGAMAIAGLPPLNGFASEWLTLQSLAHLGFGGPLGIALTGAVGLAALAMTAALALLCFVKVVGLVLLGPPRSAAAAAAVEAPAAMRAGMLALAGLCIVLGVLPGLVLPPLAALAPGGDRVPLGHHAGLLLPGTGSFPGLALAVALLVLTAALVALRGTRRAAPQPTWLCGQRWTPQLNWTSAGFTKPLRLVLDSVLRPRRELEVVYDRGTAQAIRYSAHVPALAETLLYDPTVRAGLRAAALTRRLQTGNVRTYAAYLLALVGGLLVLVASGALG
ncbi:MAG TPA: proton-conducting transporter membrane subunit [Solirubrobacteraceae bacterium]|nr:proton-conducting transporter membrane subunit [Solirubrobacteraceae bacterium]